ncbi:hypothetical protein AMECASPLE_027059 [Ameca splendens]|uniref:Uncharacterized protein n=1 Tax=Ameca splendens TaxID=208324 RepID=A0ABV0YS42_9TELE
MPDGDEQVVSSDGKVSKNLSKSLYPHIVWYQTCDSLIVTVKLMNPESQRCDFYTDRVVYRSAGITLPRSHLLVILPNIQWNLFNTVLYTGGIGYMLSTAFLYVI